MKTHNCLVKEAFENIVVLKTLLKKEKPFYLALSPFPTILIYCPRDESHHLLLAIITFILDQSKIMWAVIITSKLLSFGKELNYANQFGLYECSAITLLPYTYILTLYSTDTHFDVSTLDSF